MKIRAMVLGPVETKHVAKDRVKHPNLTNDEAMRLPEAEKYVFNTLNVVDADAPGKLQDRLVLDINREDVNECMNLAGKTVVVNLYVLKNDKGVTRYYYGGLHQAAVAVDKKAA